MTKLFFSKTKEEFYGAKKSIRNWDVNIDNIVVL